ncbi:MAG: M20/M25/M40 family metallo-hydrolase [Planctomycetota bacterium]|jgi:acetylornithine deacetylase/succinyl-diaminopimelate desuccinylase-like protein
MAIVDDLVRDTVEICSVAAPTGGEAERARLIAARLRETGLRVETDGAGNVVAEVPGEAGLPCLALAAHLDTVFPDEGTIPVHREGGWLRAPGIGDDSAGLAALLALARELPREGSGRILLVATVGEEGAGDLRGARHLCSARAGEIDVFVAVEGGMRDRLVVGGVGGERLRVVVRGPGGHSWGDAGAPCAIRGAAHLVGDLYALDLPTDPRTTLSVGTIRGGHSVNSIAAEARFEVDVRSTDQDTVRDLKDRALAVIREVPEGLGVEVEAMGSRPAGVIDPAHPLLDHCRRAREEVGLPPAGETVASTDANIPLSLGIPAACVGVGVGEDGHRRTERLRIDGLAEGYAALLAAVRRISSDPALVRPR